MRGVGGGGGMSRRCRALRRRRLLPTRVAAAAANAQGGGGDKGRRRCGSRRPRLRHCRRVGGGRNARGLRGVGGGGGTTQRRAATATRRRRWSWWPRRFAQLRKGRRRQCRVDPGRGAGASGGKVLRRGGCSGFRASRRQAPRARWRRGSRRGQRLGGGDSATLPRPCRPPLGDGRATAALASRNVAGCTGGGAAAEGAAPTRAPDMVDRM